MKTIKYNNKQYKLPFDVSLPDDPTATDTVRNRFGGESCTLPAFAIAVYDVIIGAEMLATADDKLHGYGASRHWNTVRKNIDWFIKNNAKAYMVLLD